MQLFFSQNIHNNIAILEEEEARHLTQVLRRKVGDNVFLTDGLGSLYEGKIVDILKKTCSISIEKTQNDYQKRPVKLHIAIAPTKNIDRFEWFLEKATEIGIDEITPIICKNSERTVIKPERLNSVLLSAMKQSLKTYLPKLNEVIDFKKFINKDFSEYQLKAIAHCYEDIDFKFRQELKTQNSKLKTLKHPLSMAYEKGTNSVILIGPEGDFSIDELGLAFERGFEAISLGNSRLRTETAGLVACHSINFLNNL